MQDITFERGLQALQELVEVLGYNISTLQDKGVKKFRATVSDGFLHIHLRNESILLSKDTSDIKTKEVDTI